MKKNLVSRTLVLLTLLAGAVAWPARLPAAQDFTDALDLVRGVYEADREALVSKTMQFTETESAAFWPLYREYRAEREKLGDELVKLVLAYADVYPDVPEDRAKELLKRYSTIEKKLAAQRTDYLKKFAKAMPSSKVLRLAQLENRLDLLLRLQVASRIPLAPTEGHISAVSMGAAVTAEGVPGGIIVQTHQLTASVISIQKASRKMTLLSPDGIKETIQVGPDVVNFDQIRAGDRIRVVVTEELVVHMAEPGESSDAEAAAVVALAPQGAKPGGIMAETIQVTATIKNIDESKRTATLEFADGSTRTFAVRDDLDLGKRKVGEKVVFGTAAMVALSVTKL